MPRGWGCGRKIGRWRPGAASLAALAVCASGCASVRVHGVVDEPDGRPIENARITLFPPGEGAPATAAVTSDPKGCFFLYERARPESRVYHLTIESPGRKPLSVEVPPGRLNVLRVTLVAEAGLDPSRATSIAPSERPLLYEARCEPAARASDISLH